MKRRIGIALALALGGFGSAWSEQGPGARGPQRAADEPVIQAGDNSRIAHEQHLLKAKLGAGKIGVYFVGDSIARRWGCSDPNYAKYLANWTENFFGWNVSDFAWGADRVENILWRLRNGELDDVNPQIIVMHGGTNNLNPRDPDANAEDITKGLRAVLAECRKHAPNAIVVITGVFPRNDNMAHIPVINKINDNLAKLAEGKKVRFLNVNDKLADKDGRLFEGMMNSDRLHPDLKGYQVWADGLKPIFQEILGPRGKEDHAPPPTGDPKVRPEYPPK